MEDKQKQINTWICEFKKVIKDDAKEYIPLIKSLDEIFQSGYHIMYSKSYSIVKEILGECYSGEEIYVSECIEKMIAITNTLTYIDNKEKILKFLDYLLLEMSRYIENIKTIYEMKNEVEHIRSMYNYAVKENDRLNENILKTNFKLENSTSHYISILSIFAGIIIAFMGGISLIGSAFSVLGENISEYKLFFMVTLVGFIIYNTIVGLIFMIARLTKRDVGISCKFGGNNCNSCPCFDRIPKILKPFKVICQAIVKYTYITLVNVILLYLMYIIWILWLYSPNNNLYFRKIIESDSRNIWMLTILLMPITICLVVYGLLLIIHIIKFVIHKVIASIRKIFKNK